VSFGKYVHNFRKIILPPSSEARFTNRVSSCRTVLTWSWRWRHYSASKISKSLSVDKPKRPEDLSFPQQRVSWDRACLFRPFFQPFVFYPECLIIFYGFSAHSLLQAGTLAIIDYCPRDVRPYSLVHEWRFVRTCYFKLQIKWRGRGGHKILKFFKIRLNWKSDFMFWPS
jgi:hypothetical protein